LFSTVLLNKYLPSFFGFLFSVVFFELLLTVSFLALLLTDLGVLLGVAEFCLDDWRFDGVALLDDPLVLDAPLEAAAGDREK
jgi:hypothetical protein